MTYSLNIFVPDKKCGILAAFLNKLASDYNFKVFEFIEE